VLLLRDLEGDYIPEVKGVEFEDVVETNAQGRPDASRPCRPRLKQAWGRLGGLIAG
jgi:hypothetical protein